MKNKGLRQYRFKDNSLEEAFAMAWEKANTESLLKKVDDANKKLNLQVDIVKHIVTSKLSDAEAVKTRAENRMKRDKIAAIIAEKQDEGLKNMSIEDLQKAMDEND